MSITIPSTNENPIHNNPVFLRDVEKTDLLFFFENQKDPDANHMAAFTVKDPANLTAFIDHWGKILVDKTVTIKTIVFNGSVAGHILIYEQSGEQEISYWIGKAYWGKGLATNALSQLLSETKTYPLYARAAKDNIASIRVLEKCGFTIIGDDKGFSNARGEEIEELILKLA